MKRCISLILALILFCPVLFSCGGSAEKESDRPTIEEMTPYKTTDGTDDPDNTPNDTSNSQTENNPTYEISDPYTLYCNQLLLDGGPQLTTLQTAPIPDELYQYCSQNDSASDEAPTLEFDEERAVSQIKNELSTAYGNIIYKIESITPTLISLPNSRFAYMYVVYTVYTDGEGFLCNGELCYAWGSHGFEFLIIAN